MIAGTRRQLFKNLEITLGIMQQANYLSIVNFKQAGDTVQVCLSKYSLHS